MTAIVSGDWPRNVPSTGNINLFRACRNPQGSIKRFQVDER